jgi:hypothetical protein
MRTCCSSSLSIPSQILRVTRHLIRLGKIGCAGRSEFEVSETESTAQLIGRLILEEIALEKKIGLLRDEAARRATTYARIGRLLLFQPERIFFDGENVDEQFAGEPAADRTLLDVDGVLRDLRAAIIDRKKNREWLTDLGVDREELEHQENLRKSRALRSQANDGDGSGRTTRPGVGFTKPAKKAS